MRIKKDADSWHASGVLVRDARADKSFDGATGPPKKKKKKAWCGGKEGRTHVLVWRESKWSRGMRQLLSKRVEDAEIACERCGKVFQWCSHGWLGRKKVDREALMAKWREKLGVPE